MSKTSIVRKPVPARPDLVASKWPKGSTMTPAERDAFLVSIVDSGAHFAEVAKWLGVPHDGGVALALSRARGRISMKAAQEARATAKAKREETRDLQAELGGKVAEELKPKPGRKRTAAAQVPVVQEEAAPEAPAKSVEAVEPVEPVEPVESALPVPVELVELPETAGNSIPASMSTRDLVGPSMQLMWVVTDKADVPLIATRSMERALSVLAGAWQEQISAEGVSP